MAIDNVDVNFKCPKCGCTTITLPDNHTDKSHATCKECGADFGPYGDIKKRAVGLVKKEAIASIKKGLKGIKFK